jgi:Na+/proline symporter
LGWNLYLTIVAIGLMVIVYTVSGGTRAVSQTQLFQMAIMIGGMLVAIGLTLSMLPQGVGLTQALTLAGASAKLNAIDWRIDFNERYTIWSGLLGGFFLSLSYFGTDQSQVARYLGGKSLADSRLGLLFNGLFKIPMQVMILLAGVLVYVFFIFTPAPIYFNPTLDRSALNARSEVAALEVDYHTQVAARREAAYALIDPAAPAAAQETYRQHDRRAASARQQYRQAVAAEYGKTYATDSDYIFLNYILNWFPVGLIGLLLAVILSAAMSSTSGELNALSSATVVDFLLRLRRQPLAEPQQVRLSKLITLLWGLVAIGFACTASLVDNLIQAINIMGSLFYGTILGVFLVGIVWPRITGSQVFWAAFTSEAVIIGLYFATDLGFLWYNALACGLVFAGSGLLALWSRSRAAESNQ